LMIPITLVLDNARYQKCQIVQALADALHIELLYLPPYSPNLMIPITLVLDNARYQKCQIVQALADALHIELLYLPPYSPNLNLIERLWKFVKKKCLYAKYYSDFSLFFSTISDCLAQPHIHFKLELTSLLTLKFQSFDKTQIVTV
ncbi:transposase, partial [Pseudanabaena sp. SR411]|uniref:transposase n=1 Tax=Pseudanabaena sp. SR411 TaxID=1980935 RepID=UPI00159610DB